MDSPGRSAGAPRAPTAQVHLGPRHERGVMARCPDDPTPLIVSIQVGRPQLRREADGLVWSSAIFKQPVQGPVWLCKTNLEGDRQADLQAHGGPDKAVLAYSADHYAAWQRELNVAAIEYGAFGENVS